MNSYHIIIFKFVKFVDDGYSKDKKADSNGLESLMGTFEK